MRILAVHSFYRQRGGEDVVFEAEAELLESFGHRVVRLTRDNVSFSELPAHEMMRLAIVNRKVADSIDAIVRQEQIDVVHFHNVFPSITAAAIAAAHHAGAATVQTLHNFRLLCPKAVCFREGEPCTLCIDKSLPTAAIRYRCFHDSRSATALVAMHNWWHRQRETYRRFLDRAIAPTHFVRERYERSQYPMAPIRVKPHFVADRDPVGTGSGGYALFVGRLSEEKGLPTLLQAWDRLKHPIPLRIIGEGPLADALQSRARSGGGNADRAPIQWLGWLPAEEVSRQVGEAAMLCLPSACGESFGRVVVESFARGTPVVCSDHGGQRELVHEAVGGCFRRGDPDDLARAVDELSARLEQGPELRQAARAEYEARFTAASNHKDLIAIYNEAIEARDAKKHGRRPGKTPFAQPPTAVRLSGSSELSGPGELSGPSELSDSSELALPVLSTSLLEDAPADSEATSPLLRRIDADHPPGEAYAPPPSGDCAKRRRPVLNPPFETGLKKDGPKKDNLEKG